VISSVILQHVAAAISVALRLPSQLPAANWPPEQQHTHAARVGSSTKQHIKETYIEGSVSIADKASCS
jgi:hypothetical protein